MIKLSIARGSRRSRAIQRRTLVVASVLPKLAARHKRQPLTRSQMMGRIRSRDTRPERVTGAALQALGIRFRRHAAELPGRPDFVNRKRKWAIFVHGCFWHGHTGCQLASRPKSNRGYWTEKLRRNRERDTARIKLLRLMGFRILVLWECETRSEKRLQRALRHFFRMPRQETGCFLTGRPEPLRGAADLIS